MNLFVVLLFAIMSLLINYFCFKKLKSSAFLAHQKSREKIIVTGAIGGFILIYALLFQSYVTLERQQARRLEHALLREKNKTFYRQETDERKQIYESDIGLRYSIPSSYSEAYSSKTFYNNIHGRLVLTDSVNSTISIQYKYIPEFFIKYSTPKMLNKASDEVFNTLEEWMIKTGPSVKALLADSTDFIINKELKRERKDGFNGCFYWFKREYQRSSKVSYVFLNLFNIEHSIRVTVNFTIEQGIGREAIDIFLKSVCIE